MTRQEIQEINQAISERGLKKKLKKFLKIHRPTISDDTIGRAWKVEVFDEAPETLQLVLRIAKEVKQRDDERVRLQVEQLEAEEAHT